MRLKRSLAQRLLPRARRYLGMNCLRVMGQAPGESARRFSPHRWLDCRLLSEKEMLRFASDPALDRPAPRRDPHLRVAGAHG